MDAVAVGLVDKSDTSNRLECYAQGNRLSSYVHKRFPNICKQIRFVSASDSEHAIDDFCADDSINLVVCRREVWAKEWSLAVAGPAERPSSPSFSSSPLSLLAKVHATIAGWAGRRCAWNTEALDIRETKRHALRVKLLRSFPTFQSSDVQLVVDHTSGLVDVDEDVRISNALEVDFDEFGRTFSPPDIDDFSEDCFIGGFDSP